MSYALSFILKLHLKFTGVKCINTKKIHKKTLKRATSGAMDCLQMGSQRGVGICEG